MTRDRAKVDEPQEIESPGIVAESYLAEEIHIPGKGLAFTICNRMADGSWETRDDSSIHEQGRVFVPMKQPLWPLSGRPVDYGSDEELHKDLCEFFMHYQEHREKRNYDIMSAWTMMTHRIEEFDSVLYLNFLGPPGRAKSRGLELLEQVCYRGWFVTHPSPPSVFWAVDHYGTAVLADNYEFWPKETRNELDGLFNSGYRRGAVVPRRVTEGLQELVVYKVFSPKAVAGTRSPPPSLGSRSYQIKMGKNRNPTPLKIDKTWGLKLRCMLLAYRIRHFQMWTLAPKKDEEIMNSQGRVGEIFFPVLQAAANSEIAERLSDLALGIVEDQKEEEATSLEAEIVSVILACKDRSAVGNRLAVQTIVEEVNFGRGEKEKLTGENVGWVTNRLGFRKGRMPDQKGSRAIILDDQLLQNLQTTYDINAAPATTPPKSLSDRQTVRKEGLPTLRSETSDSLAHSRLKPSDTNFTLNSDGSDSLTGKKGGGGRESGLSEPASDTDEGASKNDRGNNGSCPESPLLAEVKRLTREKGKATRWDLEAHFHGTLSPEQIELAMKDLVRDSLADVVDWGIWKATGGS